MEGASYQIPNYQFFFELEALHHLILRLCPQSIQQIRSPPEMAGVEGKRKRSKHHIRMAMYFDSTLKTQP